MSYNSDNRFDLAVVKFESMLRTNSVYFFDSEDFTDIINHYLEKGKILKAKTAIQVGLEQHPGDIEISVLKAELLILEEKPDLAMGLLLDLKKINSTNPEIYIQIANIYSRKNLHKEAISKLKEALSCLEDGDEVSDIYALLGMEHLYINNYRLAKDYFQKCLSQDAEDYTALYNTVYCYDFLKDHEGAISFLNDYLEKEPYCEIAWHQLGMQYIHKAMYKEALTCFEFAIISDDMFIGAYIEKGKVLETLGKYNEAIDNYKYTIQIEPPSAYVYFRMGICHTTLGNTDLAIASFEKSTHEDPLFDKAWYELSELYVKKENLNQAHKYIKKAIEVDSKNEAYWIKYYEISTITEMEEESSKALNHLLNIREDQFKNYFLVAQIQLKLGQIHLAIKTLTQGIEIFKNQAELHYMLSVAYIMRAEESKASVSMRKALYIDYDMHRQFKKLYPHIFKLPHITELLSKLRDSNL